MYGEVQGSAVVPVVATAGAVAVLPHTGANTLVTIAGAVVVDLITIIPGPTSVFRSYVFEKLDFCTGSLCEDLDVTIQIHDKKLGRIKFCRI